MPSQIQSISPVWVAFGFGIALLLSVLVGLNYIHIHPAVLIATVLLGLVVAVQGVKPFGETVAYMLILSGSFACWGLTVIVVDELTVTSGAFAVAGPIGLLYYAFQAVQQGIWAPRNE